jgi:hypothetical protein
VVDGFETTRSATIPVRLIIERVNEHPISVEPFRVHFLSAQSPGLDRQSSGFSAEGIARIENVFPGEYHPLLDLPPGVYVKEMQYGRTDALRDALRVTTDVPQTLRIVLSEKVAEIDGTVMDPINRTPVPDSEVVLIPDHRDRRDLYKMEKSDENGHFIFHNLAPGGYRVLSWAGLEPKAYMDPEILTQHILQGRPAQVGESEHRTIEVFLASGLDH